MNTIKLLWKRINEIGLENKDIESIESRSIVYSNQFSFIIALLLFQNILFNAFYSLFLYSFLDFILILFLLPVFILNKHRFYKSAGIYLVSFANLGIFIIDSMVGKEAGNYMYYVSVILLNFFVIDSSKKRIIIINFLITSLLLISLELTDHSLFLDKTLTILHKQYLFTLAVFTNCSFITFCLYRIIYNRSKIELELQNEEKTLKSIFNFSPLGIALLNKDKTIESFNINFKNNFSKITNLEIQTNKNLLDYVSENDLQNFRNYFSLIEEGKTIRIEKNFKTDFTSNWFDITFSPILGNDNSYNKIVLTFVDITKRKQLEMEAEVAKEKAEAANTSKSQFLSSMSSEIGTPMKAIIDITDELIAEFPRKDQRDSLNQLKSSNEKLLILIKDIVNSEARIQNNRNIC